MKYNPSSTTCINNNNKWMTWPLFCSSFTFNTVGQECRLISNMYLEWPLWIAGLAKPLLLFVFTVFHKYTIYNSSEEEKTILVF